MNLAQSQRFGRLLLIRRDRYEKRGKTRYWLCRCDCGTERLINGKLLRAGKAQSCGCLQRETRQSRRLPSEYHRTKKTWEKMLERCQNPRHQKFPAYGAAGIAVCDRWLEFSAFYADMGPRPVGMTIDRIDGLRGYEPGNCRWASHGEQHDNRRVTWWVTIGGHRESLRAACARLGLSSNLVRNRLSRGWSEDDAFSRPARNRSRESTR